MFFYYVKGLVLSFLLLLINSYSFAAKPNDTRFKEVELTAPFKLTHPIMTVDLLEQKGKEIITFSIDEEGNRWLIVYSFTNNQTIAEINRLKLAKTFYSFDITEYKAGELQTVYFLSNDAIFQFAEPESKGKKFTPVTKVQSIAVGSQDQHLSKGSFLVDINNDNEDDFFIPDFNHTHLILKKNQTINQVTLPIKPRAVFSSKSTEYLTTPLFFNDMNLDGLLDVIYVEKGQLVYFIQTTKGVFEVTPKYLTINEKIHGIDWWDQVDDNGNQYDQSNLSYKKVEQIKDLNNDNIADMVIRYTQSEGVLDKTNDYEVYLGRNKNGLLFFDDIPTSSIKADGTLTDIQFIDINNDNKSEVLVSGFDIGVSQIIGALLSGSIDQDVHLFYMDEKDTFNKKLKVSKEVELSFSLSSGTSGSPIVKLADVNGDKWQDLILSDDNDTLLLYFGGNHKSLFTKKSEKYKTLLPVEGSMVIHDDINGDGKDDLLIKYGREDNKKLTKIIKILIAQ